MRSVVLALMAGSLLGTPATAAPPALAPQVWQVDWEGSRCSISTGDPKSQMLALWVTPGEPRPELYLVVPTGSLVLKIKKVTITLQPSGTTFRAGAYEMSAKGGSTIFKVVDLKEDFPPAFGKATEIRMTGFNHPVTIPAAGSDKAMVALKGCLDEELPKWGIDAKAYDALRSPPLDPGDHDWMDYYDYPQEAREKQQEGDVVARLSVDAKGKVTDCAVVSSSGSESIDKMTCEKTLRKARFIPAVGADGKPTAAQRTIRAIFRLGD